MGSLTYSIYHPQHRKVFFLGDLVDRGPNSPEVLHLAMDRAESGQALLAETLLQLSDYSDLFIQKCIQFIIRLMNHYILDEGNLVVLIQA